MARSNLDGILGLWRRGLDTQSIAIILDTSEAAIWNAIKALDAFQKHTFRDFPQSLHGGPRAPVSPSICASPSFVADQKENTDGQHEAHQIRNISRG